jgi:putative ABC transport system permease protein
VHRQQHLRTAATPSSQADRRDSLKDLYDAVLGTEVAESLGYRLGDSIVVAHGASDVLKKMKRLWDEAPLSNR